MRSLNLKISIVGKECKVCLLCAFQKPIKLKRLRASNTALVALQQFSQKEVVCAILPNIYSIFSNFNFEAFVLEYVMVIL
jgi:hypothetical protein